MRSCDIFRYGLAMLALVLALGRQSPAHAQQCFVQPCLPPPAAQNWTLAKTTGSPHVDVKLVREARYLAESFGVQPEVFIFNDGHWPNAYANPRNLPPYRDTIFFGHSLINQTLFAADLGEIAVILVMAHEWAHILQGAVGLPPDMQQIDRELHADFLAGWYLGRRNLVSRSAASQIAHRTYGRAPHAHVSADTHGTADARLAAMMSGYDHRQFSTPPAFDLGFRILMGVREATARRPST